MIELAIRFEVTDPGRTEAQLTAWFTNTIQREGARLEWERNHLYRHELLILDGPSTPHGQDMLSELAASDDTELVAEDEVFTEEVLMLLTLKQRMVILETVIQDVPEQIVADEFGTSQQAVHRLKVRALKKLRNYLSDC